jgi:hypothetical protein
LTNDIKGNTGVWPSQEEVTKKMKDEYPMLWSMYEKELVLPMNDDGVS